MRLEFQALQKPVADIILFLIPVSVQGNIVDNCRSGSVAPALSAGNAQQRRRLARAASPQKQDGSAGSAVSAERKSGYTAFPGKQGNLFPLLRHGIEGIYSFWVLQIVKGRVFVQGTPDAGAAGFPQCPVGNAPAQDPVFQLRNIRAHLLRALKSSARCDLKAPAEDPAQQGEDRLRTVLQKREFGGIKADRGIASHLQGGQLSACQAYIEHGSQGIQVCPLPDP